MSVVRVVVKLQSTPQDVEYLTFNWNLFSAPCPQIGDELCFGDYFLVVRARRYRMPTVLEAPAIALHAGLTGRRARTPVTRAELTEIIKGCPTVEVIG
jgi:hypothetical protein